MCRRRVNALPRASAQGHRAESRGDLVRACWTGPRPGWLARLSVTAAGYGYCTTCAARCSSHPRSCAPALGSRPASGVYPCPGCGERLAGARRCEDCNLSARRPGEGGRCTTCSEILTFIALLDTLAQVVTGSSPSRARLAPGRASTSRTDNPRTNEAITNASSAFVRDTPVPNSWGANRSVVPRSFGRSSFTGRAVVVIVVGQ